MNPQFLQMVSPNETVVVISLSMNQSIQYLADTQITQSLVTHSELIGKNVQWMQLVDRDDGVGQDVQYLENDVVSVKIEMDGSIRLLLDNRIYTKRIRDVASVIRTLRNE